MKYEFDSNDAYGIAQHIRAESRVKGDELFFKSCPYCNGGSGRRRDDWTFSINLSNGQHKCFRSSCGITGNMVTLAKDFDYTLSNGMETYKPRKQYRKLNQPKKKIETKDDAVNYLESRGISKKIAEHYEITVHKDKPEILVFPFFDDSGELQFIKYRNSKFDPEKDKNKEWCEIDCKPILFGMKQCDSNINTLVITEGQIDSLSVAEAGICNAVSVPTGAKGFTWVPHCWDWMNKFDKLIVFGDNENGKITLLEDLKKRFNGIVLSVQQKDYKGCKDANELLIKHGKDAVRKAVECAKPIPIKQVKDLSDVDSVDIYSMPKIPTGIKSLDTTLSGGFYYGQTIILTGKRGDGKSTLASQIIVNALEYGKKVFAYSGELPGYFFKRWLDMQAAGSRNIISQQQDDKTSKPFIRKSILEQINEWYRGRAFLFDNNASDDDEMEDLLKIIEESIRQYGIDLVVLDNLMTALDVSMNVDLYRAQSKFVDKLVKLSKRLNVVVVLVVHPRKNRFGNDDNDEISGSADIANKADIIMTYKRGTDLPDDERDLSISKNRLTGKLAVGENQIRLYYDQLSKRISDNRSGFNDTYGWMKKDDFIKYNGCTPFDEENEYEQTKF